MRTHPRRPERVSGNRLRVAAEAARIMVQDQVHDFAAAKRRAASRLGLAEPGNLPSNAEVEAERLSYLRTFHAERLEAELHELRVAAAQALELLRDFAPRVAGPVWRGGALRGMPVEIHVHCDAPEDVLLHLQALGIDFEQDERILTGSDRKPHPTPRCRFRAGDTAVEISILPTGWLQHAPICPVDGRPMKRGDLPALRALLGVA